MVHETDGDPVEELILEFDGGRFEPHHVRPARIRN
jgi:hypothetical protein